MALTTKERERIIEEEKLRYETRQTLHHEACAKHKPRRWLWWVVAALIAYAAYCHFFCGGASCHHGMGMGMGAGKHCVHPGMEGPDEVEPGQPLPGKK